MPHRHRALCSHREDTTDTAINPRREWRYTWISIAITLMAALMVTRDLAGVGWQLQQSGQWAALSGHLLYSFIAAFLIYGGLVYLVTRLGYLRRRMTHTRTSEQALATLFDDKAPSLTILVPSYKEEQQVIYQTLLSAALQEYPERRVVLLIDDPATPANKDDALALAAARALPLRIQNLLRPQAEYWAAEQTAFHQRMERGVLDLESEAHTIGRHYQDIAAWFEQLIAMQPRDNHTDVFFADNLLETARQRQQQRAEWWLAQTGELTQERLNQEYQRLAALFRVDITSFERKRFENLSHEANKAMNLNSYIGLMGKSFRIVTRDNKRHLEPASTKQAVFHVPDSDYIITLDADSIIMPDYALRLVHMLESPGFERVAVAQTPYSAIPGAPGMVERIAGATTDIQYIIHQGFTAFNATFWVGANALLRKRALEEIACVDQERNHTIVRYIQDRTVIEDTESSIDLVARGWQLHNYPERLAYSATPPDFGALLIQRRRWANGGLIILPKLINYLVSRPFQVKKLAEAFMRIHYLSSIAVVNVGLLILLAVPFLGGEQNYWLPLTALGYFALYARDLRLLGYHSSDILRVYAMNLLLIPVNMGGVLKSLQQAITRSKIPFGRTPKVQGRTAIAPLYLVAIYGLLANWLIMAIIDTQAHQYGHAIFAAINTAFMGYALWHFIGVRNSVSDLLASWREWRGYQPSRITQDVADMPLLPKEPDPQPATGRSNVA